MLAKHRSCCFRLTPAHSPHVPTSPDKRNEQEEAFRSIRVLSSRYAQPVDNGTAVCLRQTDPRSRSPSAWSGFACPGAGLASSTFIGFPCVHDLEPEKDTLVRVAKPLRCRIHEAMSLDSVLAAGRAGRENGCIVVEPPHFQFFRVHAQPFSRIVSRSSWNLSSGQLTIAARTSP